jgi:hypothetical protein
VKDIDDVLALAFTEDVTAELQMYAPEPDSVSALCARPIQPDDQGHVRLNGPPESEDVEPFHTSVSHLGKPGVRDPEYPCSYYDVSFVVDKLVYACVGDGHYLCKGCTNLIQSCSGCNQEIDPETCCCGEPRTVERNGLTFNVEHDGHPFVPMGCNCHRAENNPTEDLESPF